MYGGICADRKDRLKVGVGETIITPKKNMQMAGFARSQMSTGVHDDLHARSLAVEDADGNSAILMTVALVMMDEKIGARIRGDIAAKTGVSADRIVISCTHTHAGPSMPRGGDEYDTSSGEDSYYNFLAERCVESAVKAWTGRVPGRIGIGATEVSDSGGNAGGSLRRRTSRSAGGDLQDRGCERQAARCCVQLRLPPSGLDYKNTLFSEDWPYYAISGIKKKLGQEVWIAYYQSAEGNINVGYTAELSAVGADMPVRSYWYIEKKGNQMSEAVLAALPSVKTSADVPVRSTIGRSDYPLRDSYPVTIDQAETDVKKAKETLAELEKRPEYAGTRTLDRARVDVFQTGQRLSGAKRFYGTENRPLTRSLEQQAVRIGDAVFVTFPGELFSDIGLEIKKGSPVPKTFVIGVTCGQGGYLPSAKEFIDGDYEIDGSPYSPKTEPVCIDSSLRLIRQVAK